MNRRGLLASLFAALGAGALPGALSAPSLIHGNVLSGNSARGLGQPLIVHDLGPVRGKLWLPPVPSWNREAPASLSGDSESLPPYFRGDE